MILHVVAAVAALCPAVLVSIGREASMSATDVPDAVRAAANIESERDASNMESVLNEVSGAYVRNTANVRIVRDRLVDGGPLAGIQAAMRVADTPWLLVVACDMPLITPEALRSLLEVRTAADVHAVIACDSTARMHPLCACYRRDTLPEMESYLASGGRSVHGFLDRITTAGFTMDSDEPLRNVTSKRDLPAKR